VALTGTKGSPPPETLKVALNMLGGYRNTMTMVVTGLDIEAKAAHATNLFFELVGGPDVYDDIDVRLMRFDHPDAARNEEAVAHLRITVKDVDEAKVGRAFSDAMVELALASYAGFHTTTPPLPASAYGIYWPTTVPPSVVTQRLHLSDGTVLDVPHTPGAPAAPAAPAPTPPHVVFGGARMDLPLGRLCGARSGDKGGNANVGLWARDDESYAWLRQELTVARFRDLLTEARDLEVLRYELPNLRALNFVVAGIIAPGVAGTTRPDAQAKGLGEYVRSRIVQVPIALLEP
jgi:hypothetical protein